MTERGYGRLLWKVKPAHQGKLVCLNRGHPGFREVARLHEAHQAPTQSTLTASDPTWVL